MKRDPEEYSAFVGRIHENEGALRRIGYAYATSAEDREDLEQEILLQAWRAYPSFRGQSAFSTWFYRVALNTALTRARKRRSDDAQTNLDTLEAQTRDREAAGSDVEDLRTCIQELPSLDRAIIVLALERHSYEEIAEITGLSKSNVSVRLVRIKERLRQRLEALGHRQGVTP